MEHGANIWPSYYQIQKEKKATYPEGLEVSDYEAVVPMRALLRKTTERLMEVPGLREKLQALKERLNGKVSLVFRFKWGIDGTGGFNVYREGVGSSGDNRVETVLMSQMAFLELRCVETGKVVVRNEFACSPSSQRPIRLAFEKEN